MNTSLKINCRRSPFLGLLFPILILFFSCKEVAKKNDTKSEEARSEVILDADFENLLIVDRGGVTGADGAISFPLKNGKSVFMMGDSFLCPVEDHKRDPNCRMINNTFIVVDKEKGTSKSIYAGTLDDPGTMIIPANGEKTKEYYWPGHGFEEDGVLHIFMSKFWDDETIKEGWKFKFRGTDYLRLEPDGYEIISEEKFPFTDINSVHYGHSLLKEEDYTYIYGSRSDENRADLHVARAKLDSSENRLSDYEFFDGKTWTSDAGMSHALQGIEKDVPEQFSVFRHQDKYVLVMQERGLLKGNIYSYIADSPSGPWTNETLIYHTKEQANTKDKIITYNAMAHSQYIENDLLLISYCVNSLDAINVHEVNTDFYRPKFVWVSMDHILARAEN